jgi:6-phosphogluconolactonase (cycloisomerase 2 family)
MTRATMLVALLAAALGALVAAQAAYTGGGKNAQLVFVQTNEVSGNRIVVYRRGDDGLLSQPQAYPTGGNGGIAAPGNESDRLASQGSLVYDQRHSLLFAVNAGSNTVSMFSVRGDRIELEDVEPSGGDFPASVAVDRDLVYVLNAGGTGVLQGFRIDGDELQPISGSSRSLGLANTSPPNFLTSPGQVGFTPDHRQLLVTTKAAKNTIEVFDVGRDGLLSAMPVVNPSATPVPFAFVFDSARRLVSGEAGTSSVTTYKLGRDGTLRDPQSLSDNQVALCWIVRARDGFYYVSNTGSNTLSGYKLDGDLTPMLVTPTGIVAQTDPGPIDMTVAAHGRFLYAQTGAGGSVHAYAVNRDGTLTEIQKVTGLPVGMEGIAAT